MVSLDPIFFDFQSLNLFNDYRIPWFEEEIVKKRWLKLPFNRTAFILTVLWIFGSAVALVVNQSCNSLDCYYHHCASSYIKGYSLSERFMHILQKNSSTTDILTRCIKFTLPRLDLSSELYLVFLIRWPFFASTINVFIFGFGKGIAQIKTDFKLRHILISSFVDFVALFSLPLFPMRKQTNSYCQNLLESLLILVLKNIICWWAPYTHPQLPVAIRQKLTNNPKLNYLVILINLILSTCIMFELEDFVRKLYINYQRVVISKQLAQCLEEWINVIAWIQSGYTWNYV